MSSKKDQMHVEGLGRILLFILARKPDEFGLVPDSEGYVAYKELLKALHEEPGWSHVRRSHINELLMGKHKTLFDSDDERIRAIDRHWRVAGETSANLREVPKILYTPVRTRAHPAVLERGLHSRETAPIVLSADKEMAMRIGKRRDQRPVLVEVLAAAVKEEGGSLRSFGRLFLASHIPAKFIAGPPVPKHLFKKESSRGTKEKVEPPPNLPGGTFAIEWQPESGPRGRGKGRKRKGWKEGARSLRKGKRG